MSTQFKTFMSTYWILFLFVIIKFILQYLALNPYYELQRDEYLHLDQANHLAWGFISVPPFSSWVSKIIFLFGGSYFWIKFFPALFGALTIVLGWLIVEKLGGKLFSKVLVASCLTFSIYVRLNTLYQPNSFDILSWTIIFYCLVGYVQSQKFKWLVFLSIAIALGIYNKYNVVFLLIGILAGILIVPQRKLFFNIKILIPIGIVLLLLLPNILWQINHQLPVLKHFSVLSERQLVNNTASYFLKNQVLIFIGSLPVTIFAFVGFAIYQPFKIYRFVVLSFCIVMALFASLGAKDYYALGLFPVMVCFGSVYMENVLREKWYYYLRPVPVVFNILIFAMVFKYVMPVLSPPEIETNRNTFEKIGLLRWEDGKNHQLPQDFADMTGWKEMADKAYRAYQMIPENEKEQTLIFCDNYGQTGAVNYFNRNRMPESYSFNTDYIFWLPKKEVIKNIILVGDRPDEKILKMFQEIIEVGKVENKYARELNTGIFILKGANQEFTSLFYKIARERIDTYDIF